MMSGEAVSLDALARPRLAVPAGWISDLDEPTAAAWRSVSAGVPEIDFADRQDLHQVGLTILLYEAAQYHRRWATEVPEKYGPDVLRLIRLGFDVSEPDYRDAIQKRQQLADEAMRAMDGIEALILPATAMVAPRTDAGHEVREPLSRFTRPFNTTQQPVAVVPAPVKGLPVGIQVAAKTNTDALRAAAWLEREWR
jgi:aspartyl-tRNA(Asn)/glutamyl-tRNA(Gln) amidotransferase subunit A